MTYGTGSYGSTPYGAGDDAGLTLYWAIQPSATANWADNATGGAQIRNGQDGAGSALPAGSYGSQAYTAAGASNAISTLDSALANIDASRANLGAIQNRFMSVISNLATNSENLSAARSRIRDADFASETANLSKAQILQQAGTAMLAQANSAPQNVLSLLR